MSAIEQFQSQNLMQQADMLSKSGIVPKAFRGKPADVLAACLWGAEIGLGPMASMGYIDVIEGTPTINAEGCNALVRRAGHSLVVKATPTSAVATGTRRDTGDTMTVEWTMDMARRAGLANKQVWKSYPEAMLTARAVTQLCRSLFPDVLAGISYAPEEAASFAAPEMLDAQPERLAGAPEQAALPAPQEVAGSSPAPVGAAGDAGSVTRSGADLPQAQVVQSKPRTFPAPGQSQPKNQDEFTARDNEPPFTDADRTLASVDEMRALRKELDEMDETTLLAVSKAWVDAQLPSIKTRKQIDKADYERALTLVLDVKEKVAAEVAQEDFFKDDDGGAAA